MIQKRHSFTYIGSQAVYESKGQRSMHIYGPWPLNFDHFLTEIGTSKVYETIHFLNLHDNLINLSPFSLKLDQLENLTIVLTCNWKMKYLMNFV